MKIVYYMHTMKSYFSIFIFITISLLGFFLSPIKISSSKNFNITSVIDLNQNETKNLEPDAFLWSKIDVIYFSFKNKSFFKYTTNQNSLLSANNLFFVEFNKENSNISIYSNKGVLIKTIQEKALVYIPKDLPIFFLIKSNGKVLSILTMNGDYLLKDITVDSLITSISIDKNFNTLISTIDGNTILIDKIGKILFKTKNNKSKFSIAKANTISENGKLLAICCGKDPEYIEIYDLKTGKIIKEIKNKKNNLEKIFLQFENRKLYYQNENTLCYYDLKKNKSYVFHTNGIIKDIALKDNNVLIVTTDGVIDYLYLYSSNNQLLCYKELANPISDINFINSYSFFFKYNDKIIKMSYSNEALS